MSKATPSNTDAISPAPSTGLRQAPRVLAHRPAHQGRPEMEVILASTTDELDAVFRLRHEIYVEEMGLLPADHPFVHEGRLIDGFDAHSANLLLLVDGAPAGTIRLTSAAEGPLEVASYRDISALCDEHPDAVEITRFMVKRPLRGKSAGRLLFLAAWRCLQASHSRLIIAAGKVGNLGRYYRNLGLKQVDDELFEYSLVGSARYALLSLDLGPKRSLTRLGWRLFATLFETAMLRFEGLGDAYLRRGFSTTTLSTRPTMLQNISQVFRSWLSPIFA